jgi:hypothetical protein
LDLRADRYIACVTLDRHACDARQMAASRPELSVVADWPKGVRQCVDCGVPSGKRQRCPEHHARHASDLAAARQRRRRAELKPRPATGATASAIVDAADALRHELAGVWAQSDLVGLENFLPALRAAARLLLLVQDDIKGDSRP